MSLSAKPITGVECAEVTHVGSSAGCGTYRGAPRRHLKSSAGSGSAGRTVASKGRSWTRSPSRSGWRPHAPPASDGVVVGGPADDAVSRPTWRGPRIGRERSGGGWAIPVGTAEWIVTAGGPAAKERAGLGEAEIVEMVQNSTVNHRAGPSRRVLQSSRISRPISTSASGSVASASMTRSFLTIRYGGCSSYRCWSHLASGAVS